MKKWDIGNENVSVKTYVPATLTKELSKMNRNDEFKTNGDMFFSFSYLYLSAYMWDNGIYGKQLLKVTDIKRILKKCENDPKLDYVIKKNGLLDKNNFTKPTKDFPMGYTINNKKKKLIMNNQKLPTNYTVKEPLFYNKKIAYLEISLFEFLICIENKKLQHSGFFLYSIILNKIKKNDINFTRSTLSYATGLSKAKITELTNELQRVGLIKKINKTYLNPDGTHSTLAKITI